MTLHLSQILFTEARTFILSSSPFQPSSNQPGQNPAPPGIGGRELDQDPISGQETHTRQTGPPRRVGHHLAPAFQLHPKERVWQRLNYSTPETAGITQVGRHTKTEQASPAASIADLVRAGTRPMEIRMPAPGSRSGPPDPPR